jgi:superfamily I DNA/RNA helicase
MEEVDEAAENLLVRLVVGVAGSGKTLVLARRARYLREHFPRYKILVMAFNRDFVADLKKRIGLEDVEVYGFHQLCRKIVPEPRGDFVDVWRWLDRHASALVAQVGLPAHYIAEEIDWRKDAEIFSDEEYLAAVRKGRVQRLTREKRQIINQIFNDYRYYQEELRAKGQMWMDSADLALAALAVVENGHPLKHSYDAVLIDEAQDFAPPWIRLAKLLQKPTGTMLLCEDPLQTLFRSFTWQEKGIPVVGRAVTLRVPFRSSREICAAAYSLIEADSLLREEQRIEPNLTAYEVSSGEMPRLIECVDLPHEITMIAKRIEALLDTGVKAEHIAVLCHNHYVMNQLKPLEKYGCVMKTFGTMKGLEFQAVFVPHLHDVFQRADADDAVSTVRRRIFTAITRARETLVLSYQGTLPPALQPLLLYVQR